MNRDELNQEFHRLLEKQRNGTFTEDDSDDLIRVVLGLGGRVSYRPVIKIVDCQYCKRQMEYHSTKKENGLHYQVWTCKKGHSAVLYIEQGHYTGEIDYFPRGQNPEPPPRDQSQDQEPPS